ncbi:hypothetical protein PG989_015342 [Apiospora arundinis]|uniref:LysM domain-containing protein n=1 Tax=Apiospora arundinis TaxID=335852 RepID=A0ABR2JNM5_9PEZI
MARIILQVGIAALLAGTQVESAAIVRPRACSYWCVGVARDNCDTIAENWWLTVDQFKSYNPGVDCDRIIPGQMYCVMWAGTPPPPDDHSAS